MNIASSPSKPIGFLANACINKTPDFCDAIMHSAQNFTIPFLAAIFAAAQPGILRTCLLAWPRGTSKGSEALVVISQTYPPKSLAFKFNAARPQKEPVAKILGVVARSVQNQIYEIVKPMPKFG